MLGNDRSAVLGTCKSCGLRGHHRHALSCGLFSLFTDRLRQPRFPCASPAKTALLFGERLRPFLSSRDKLLPQSWRDVAFSLGVIRRAHIPSLHYAIRWLQADSLVPVKVVGRLIRDIKPRTFSASLPYCLWPFECLPNDRCSGNSPSSPTRCIRGNLAQRSSPMLSAHQ